MSIAQRLCFQELLQRVLLRLLSPFFSTPKGGAKPGKDALGLARSKQPLQHLRLSFWPPLPLLQCMLLLWQRQLPRRSAQVLRHTQPRSA